MAARYNFTGKQRLESGADWVRSFVLAQGDPNGPREDLEPRDLTGYLAALLVIRKQPRGNQAGGAEQLRISLATGEITLGGVTGVVSWTVTDTVITALDFDRGVYALELTDAAGIVTREFEGEVEYSRRVNRA